MALQHHTGALRRRLSRISLLVAAITAITLPLIYGYTTVRGEMRHLRAETQQNTKSISQLIFQFTDTWQFHHERIEDMLAEGSLYSVLKTTKHVVDSTGKTIIKIGELDTRLRFTEDLALYNGPQIVGRLLVARDMRPVMIETALAALLGLLLGGAMYVILVLSPMRALGNAAAELEKTAERLAAEVAEREAVEARLRQSQKLESLGQLTGGIAHDFNNLLGIIQGNAELCARKGDVDKKYFDPIMRATNRGAELTQRLLAFARQQPLLPSSVDVAGLVKGMHDLLDRSLGETIDIHTSIAPYLWPALADPGQVENAILNLSLNARAAMPEGGRLTISCSNVELHETTQDGNAEISPGDYVTLIVTDNGTGMTAETMQHVFEPFFTTKSVGEGTGLGLSMVYGFAKQSGGHVAIYSEVGKGTSVKLYLPRDRTSPAQPQKPASTKAPQGKGETILVIEDEADVRQVAIEMLETLNYRVIDVPAAAQACAVLDSSEHVDLVLSDVVLPGGISGPEFAETAKTNYPGLKVIFMSGYPADAAHRNGLVDMDGVLLNKPFRRPQLAQAVRQMLDVS